MYPPLPVSSGHSPVAWRNKLVKFATLKRPGIFVGICALLFAALCTSAQAQDWPQRPVRIVVPFAAGGNIDVLGRLVAQRLSESMGKQFIVENRVGGNGIIAAEAVARSPAD